jgi:hypothetical protein
VTPEEFLADVAVVFTGDATKGAFGSGRLIAPGLVLTAGHVVDYPTRQEPMRTGWKIRVVRERAPTGAWVESAHAAALVWRGSGGVDLALLRIIGDPVLAPKVPVFASYDAIGPIEAVDAAGFPQAWFAGADAVRDYTVRGSLRIATQYGRYAPYAWSVPSADKPDDPNGWKGMSGAAVCKVGPNQELYLFGTVQEVPANFSGGLLEVAPLSAAFADDDFCKSLRVSLGYEPRIVSWIGSIPARVLIPSVQAPAEYVERPELTDPLLSHLLGDQASAGRTMISAVHGLGGIGKTTIAQWVVWRPEIARRFSNGRIWITLGNEPPDALTIINDCVSQLDPALKAKATVEAARADLTTLLQDKSILFVVDDVWPGKSAEVAKALLVPSSHSCFLLTTRFFQLAADPRIMAKEFSLDQMSVDQARELITRALGRELRPDEARDAESLCTMVGGHPLALELAAARIKEGRLWATLLTDLGAEIANLETLEEVDDDLIESPIAEKAREKQKSVRASLLLSVRSLRRDGQQLFAWLGTISEDATITPRMAATLWATDEETALRHLRSLSGAGVLKAEGSVYRMHDLMHDLARGILSAPVIATRERDIPGLGLTLQHASRQLLERYRAKTSDGLWHTLPADGYIHDHLVPLFEQAHWTSELEGLPWEESADGHCGWYWARERLGQTPGFIADVNRIWSHADRTVAATATEGARAQAVALQLHCALITASINGLSAGISAELLREMVRCGLISRPIALTWARRHPNAYSRVCALSALAGEMLPETQPSVLSEALSIARGVDDPWSRAKALVEVAKRLPAEAQPSVLDEALSAARGILNALSSAQALAEVVRLLPAQEALLIARGIDDAGTRARALAVVATRLPTEVQQGVLGEALRVAYSIHGKHLRAETLAAVAPMLPSEQALLVARGIDDAWRRTEALTGIAARLPVGVEPSALSEALSAARGIDDERERALALSAIVPLLSAEAQPNVLSEALSAADSVAAGWSRGEALAEVVMWLPVEHALAVARRIDHTGWRVHALVTVARRLPTEKRTLLLSEAFSATQSIDDFGWWTKPLVALTNWLPAEQALVVARDIENSWFRAEALATLATRLPADAQSSVFAEVLSAARGVRDTSLRDYGLAGVIPLLPMEAHPSVLSEVLGAAHSIEDPRRRAEVLASLATRLPAEAQPSVLAEALNVARGIDNAWSRARGLASLAARLPAESRPGVVGEAFKAARSVEDARWRAEALGSLATGLGSRAQPRVLGEALRIARSVVDTWSRDEALAEISSWLPAAQALAVAREIEDARWRDRALAQVAPRLPAEQALAVARGLHDAQSRAQALAAVAPLQSAEAQPSVLREALDHARGVDNAQSRATALAAVATRLPTEEALVVAYGIEDARLRAEVLAEIAPRLPAEQALAVAGSIDDTLWRGRALAMVASRFSTTQITTSFFHQWIETIRVMATHTRSDFSADVAAVFPLINAIGGQIAISALQRSVISVGRWWPSLRGEGNPAFGKLLT